MPEAPDSGTVPFPGARKTAQAPNSPCCGVCHFWLYHQPEDALKVDLRAPRFGFCRRFPPTIHAVGPQWDPSKNVVIKGPHGHPMPDLQSINPATPDHHYCGEFQPAARPASART